MATPKRATPAQIINALRKAEVQRADGKAVTGNFWAPSGRGGHHKLLGTPMKA